LGADRWLFLAPANSRSQRAGKPWKNVPRIRVRPLAILGSAGDNLSVRSQTPIPLVVRRKEAVMIKGIHAMFYSTDPAGLRSFFRDKLGLSHSDVGDGWLIFDAAEAEVGVHPADEALGVMSGKHDISLYCDKIEKTKSQLEKKGVEFAGPITDLGWGMATQMIVPGGFNITLYEPKYKKSKGAKPKPAKKAAKAKTKVVKKKVKAVAKKKGKKK
jgi:hypothetical protein